VSVALGVLCLLAPPLASPQEARPPSGHAGASASGPTDPDDGWPDLSGFLDRAAGFVPIARPITEPAVGYGAAGGLLFVDRRKQAGAEGLARPNLSLAGGMATEDGTWGALIGNIHYWRKGRLKTTVGLFGADLNLDYQGVGPPPLQDTSVGYEWDLWGGQVGADYLLKPGGHAWIGLTYTIAQNSITFDRASEVPLPDLQDGATLLSANLSPSFVYDSRDTVFTPSRGTYLSLSGSFYEKFLGGDRDFQEADGTAIVYIPFSPRITLGLRADGMGSFGPAPFYLRPAVSLRGVTARRYIGHYVAQTEAELRYQFWKRLSVVGFAGVGRTWREFELGDSNRTVHEGGGGLRYELAWRYKLHAGFDVAWGPDGVIWYVVVGSAWARP
jgi:hypothetical protein